MARTDMKHNPQSSRGFDPIEATISSFHAALASGHAGGEAVVAEYLRRIDALDSNGPKLRAFLALNPQVREQAAALDQRFAQGRGLAGPLHGVAIAVKDNLATADMPTTGGSVALRNVTPNADATVVRRLREAGALILGKTNLHELASAGTTVSSLGGQTLNPYAAGRTPGGSSGGTGVAVAANMAMVGVGTDTGQSIRSPSSALALVGIRPTRGLVSRHGVMPASRTQDAVGPMGRTAEDVARVLEVMAGHDEIDPPTAFCPPPSSRRYVADLDIAAFKGARLGLLAGMSGTSDVHVEVNQVVDDTLERMRTLGATIVPVTIGALDELIAHQWTQPYEFAAALDAWFAQFCPAAPVRSVRALFDDGRVDASIRDALNYALVSGGEANPAYAKIFLWRDRLRLAVANLMATERLDAIVYPHQRRLVVLIGQEQFERNGVLSNATGFPAVTFPAGYSAPTTDAPLGVPIGIELLGREWSEGALLSFAHAFERNFGVRVPPMLP